MHVLAYIYNVTLSIHADKGAPTILTEQHPNDGGPVEDPYYSLPNSPQITNPATTSAKNKTQSYEAIDIAKVDYISVYSVPNEL